MKILVFGKTGQVARELARYGEVVALDRTQADLTDPDKCAAIIEQSYAQAIINAAAYTAVDRAETEEPLARMVNATAPGKMALAAARKNIPFLHISTDYVFDGRGAPAWRPTDDCAPQNVYGRTKAQGEQAVRAAGGNHAILRTSWVFSSHGQNFVKTMLSLSETRDTLSVVGDQIAGPTPASDIAKTLLIMAKAMAKGQRGGSYHYCGTPAISWHGFAKEIFKQAQRNVNVVNIPTKDYPTPAQRPLNSRLNCVDLERDFAIQQPDWKLGLANVIKDLSI